MYKPNARQEEILRFFVHFDGLFTVADLAAALDRPLTTSLRTDINLLLAAGLVVRQVVSGDTNKLAWGYTIPSKAPALV